MESKVLRGDCMSVMRGIEDESINAVITDPPYGIDFQSARRIDATKRKPKIANDEQPFIWFLYDAARVLKKGGALICFCEWRHQDTFRKAIEVAGLTIKSQVIWDRDWHGMGDLQASFAPQHDVIWFATKGKGFSFKNGRPKSVLRYLRVGASALVHPNEKPNPLMRQLVKSVTVAGDIVLDPFMGSGSTGVAAKQEGRNFIGIELDDNYASVGEARISEVDKLDSML